MQKSLLRKRVSSPIKPSRNPINSHLCMLMHTHCHCNCVTSLSSLFMSSTFTLNTTGNQSIDGKHSLSPLFITSPSSFFALSPIVYACLYVHVYMPIRRQYITGIMEIQTITSVNMFHASPQKLITNFFMGLNITNIS